MREGEWIVREGGREGGSEGGRVDSEGGREGGREGIASQWDWGSSGIKSNTFLSKIPSCDLHGDKTLCLFF